MHYRKTICQSKIAFLFLSYKRWHKHTCIYKRATYTQTYIYNQQPFSHFIFCYSFFRFFSGNLIVIESCPPVWGISERKIMAEIEKEEKTIAEDLVVTKYKLAGEIVNSKYKNPKGINILHLRKQMSSKCGLSVVLWCLYQASRSAAIMLMLVVCRCWSKLYQCSESESQPRGDFNITYIAI